MQTLKFVCVEPDFHRGRAVKVEAKNRTEARKAMCKGCIPSCAGPEKALELTPGQMSLFEESPKGEKVSG